MAEAAASPPAPAASAQRVALGAAIIAYTMWGFFPLYFLAIQTVPADEVLTHRILWSVPLGLVIILFRKQWPEVVRALKNWGTVQTLLMSAGVIALNWLVYIYAVQSGQIFQASLGYYINPLIYVLVGVVVLKEHLRRAQQLAVGLATIGVLILTFYGGTFPIIALTLACSFTIYGYIKKRATIGAMPALFIETLLLAPIAVLYLTFLVGTDRAAVMDGGTGLWLLLALSGPLTVLPLLAFAIAARRLRLATLGFLQFIGPTLQFLVGVWVGEAFTLPHALCFGFIWAAVALFAADAWRVQSKQAAS